MKLKDINRFMTDNTMTKRKEKRKDQQWSTKHHTGTWIERLEHY
jgi:hypothetical protein